MSAIDVLRSFAESREADDVPIRDGITYGTVREALRMLRCGAVRIDTTPAPERTCDDMIVLPCVERTCFNCGNSACLHYGMAIVPEDCRGWTPRGGR